MYLDANKKRTDSWLQSLGLQLPPLDHQYGSIREVKFSNKSIPETSEKSNTQKSLKTEDLLSPEYWEKKRDAGEVKDASDASEGDWFDEYVDQVKET